MTDPQPSPAFRVHPRTVAAAIFILAALLYVRTAAPTLGGGYDSEEFQHVAYDLGIAHATGYPLYLLLGKAFITLVPIGSVAYRMNLLSALLTACAAALVYLNAFTLTRRQVASVAAAALFATNPAVWRQAGVASVGPLALLLTAAILYALLLWHEKRAPLTLAAFVFGLSLAHHRTVFLLAPGIALFVLQVDPGILRRPRDIARNLFWLAVPLLFYLYMPIFGSRTPGYSNTLPGFIAAISGGDVGGYTRTTLPDLLQAGAAIAQFQFDSFGILGGILIAAGVLAAWPWKHRERNPEDERPITNSQLPTASDERPIANSHLPIAGDPRRETLTIHTLPYLALGTLLYWMWGMLFVGEADRYYVMPFVFLIYAFALGVASVESLIERMTSAGGMGRVSSSLIRPSSSVLRHPSSVLPHPSSFILHTFYLFFLALFLLLPFGDRFHYADWSAFDRVYKQWDEIFTLPIPRGAVLVGNWGQLNAMKYMQNVERRRPDLMVVGTSDDPAPQTEAARGAFADGRSIFLAPGIALPTGAYRYALLGPLLEVRDRAQTQAPEVPVRAADNADPSAQLLGWGLSTALEPYAALTHLAPTRTARVALYWRAGDAPKDFVVRLGLYDPDGRLVSQKDEPPVRGLYPASQWQPGEYVSDVHNFLIPAGSPPGVYAFKMQTLDAATNTPTRTPLALGSAAVDRVTDLTREQVFIAQPVDLSLTQQIALWGYGKLAAAYHPGDTLALDVAWYAREDAQAGADVTARFALLDASDRTAAEWPRAPVSYYPTGQWKKGEVLKAYYDLLLPRDLAPGAYSLTLRAGGEAATLGKIQIAR